MSGEYAQVGVDVVDRALLNAPRVIEIDGKPILRFDDLYSVEIRG
jgi:hypothetical protein